MDASIVVRKESLWVVSTSFKMCSLLNNFTLPYREENVTELHTESVYKIISQNYLFHDADQPTLNFS